MKEFKTQERHHFIVTCVVLVIVLFLQIFQLEYFFIHIDTVSKKLKKIYNRVETTSPLPYKELGEFKLTFYCPCEKCVGKKEVVRTASGTIPKANRTIAVDKKVIPLGSIVYIQDLGYFVAEDTGSAVKHNTIDIYVDSHEEAKRLGVKHAQVFILKGE